MLLAQNIKQFIKNLPIAMLYGSLLLLLYVCICMPVVGALFGLLFALARWKKNDALLDSAWGLGFIAIAMASALIGSLPAAVLHYGTKRLAISLFFSLLAVFFALAAFIVCCIQRQKPKAAYLFVLLLVPLLLIISRISEIGMGHCSTFINCLFAAGAALATALVVVWGVRITIYLHTRSWHKPEDERYAMMRKQLDIKNAITHFFSIFLPQGIAMLVIVYPVVLTNIYGCSAHIPTFFGYTLPAAPFTLVPYPIAKTTLMIIAFAIWLIGFACEAIADFQLYRFKQQPANSDRVMKSGLWRYSRHPNYFGEILMWWALWLLSLASNAGVFALIAIVSPLLIMYLLLRVSGIPLIEKQMAHNQEYREYKRHTSMLIPWFVRG